MIEFDALAAAALDASAAAAALDALAAAMARIIDVGVAEEGHGGRALRGHLPSRAAPFFREREKGSFPLSLSLLFTAHHHSFSLSLSF